MTCNGCARQQPGTDSLCLACIEDLNAWLRSIPDLYEELGSVRLPGSVRQSGPKTGRQGSSGSSAPVRLEVIDLLDRGEVCRRLEVWSYGADVREMCDRLRYNLLSVAVWEAHDAGDFYRSMRALCRDLGRTVGEPEESKPVGKCAKPADDGPCRGQLLRTMDGNAVYCRRCGDKPELAEQMVWVTPREAALITGKPIETIRTWFKRGQVGWSPPIVSGVGWLPIIVRRAQLAAVATFPQTSDSVNHGSAAELSPHTRDLGRSHDRHRVSPTGASVGKGVTAGADHTTAAASAAATTSDRAVGNGEAAPASQSLAGAYSCGRVPAIPRESGSGLL